MDVRRSSSPLLVAVADVLRHDVLALSAVGAVTLVWATSSIVPQRIWDLVSPLVLIGLVIVALRADREKLRNKAEIRFWDRLSGAYGCWLAADLLPVLLPAGATAGGDVPSAVDVTRKVLFALFYLLFLVAIEHRPHLRDRGHSGLDRFMVWPTATVVVIGLQLYFTLIPAFVSPGSGAPEMFFCLLDVFLVVKLALLFRQARSRRWRVLFQALLLAVTFQLLSDLYEATLLLPSERAFPEIVPPALGYLLWTSSFPLVAIAARLRHLPFPLEHEPPEEDPEKRLFQLSAQTLVLAIAFPLIFFASHLLIDPDPAAKPAREGLVFSSLLALGGLALLQRRVLERRMRALRVERSRIRSELLRREEDLRIIIERRGAASSLQVSAARFRAAFRASPDAMLLCTLGQGRILDLNSAACRWLERGEGEIVGRPFLSFELGTALRDELAQHGAVHGLETRLRCGTNGERRSIVTSHIVTLDDLHHRLFVARDPNSRI